MKSRLPFLAFLSLWIMPSAIPAATWLARDGEALKQILETATPGTTIQLASGKWSGLDITIPGSEDASRPIVLEAEEPGMAILSGPTALVLDGDHIIVRGLHFKEAVRAPGAEALITFRNPQKVESSNCRVTDLWFEDCNPEDLLVDYPWIRMYGHNNRVDHCRFSGQVHKGRAIQVRVYEPDPSHRIDHNLFLDRPPGIESNGYEIIQIGLSGDSMKPGNVIVENNMFIRCDGETEIISSKSCGNIIRNNLFLECSGSVTLRHGNFGVVSNNAFIGRGKVQSGGVRVVGTDNIIEGNYFSGLTGRTGGVVVLYCGIPDSPLNGYFAADRAILRNNIFHGNSGNAVYLNGGFGFRNRVLLPEQVELTGNVFGRPGAGGVVAVAGNLPDIKIVDNRYVRGVELGRPEQEGFDPEKLIFRSNTQGLMEPGLSKSNGSPLLSAPELPAANEVGPGWMLALPDLLLVNESRLATLPGNLSRPLLAHADSIIETGRIYSVTTNDRLPPSGDKHDYYSTGPYWWPNPETADGLPYIRIDGKFNPERDLVSDRDPLLGMVHDVESMAWAYAVSGNNRYADWGATLLRTWFLDKDTRMNPNLNHAQAIPGINDGRGTGIIDTHPFSELVDAMVILQQSPSLTHDESTALSRWFSDYTEWLLTSQNGQDEQAAINNHGTAFDLQVASLLWFTGQEEQLKQYLKETTLPRIARQIEPDGQQPLELARTRTWSYCTENLEHFFKLGLIGRKVGIDLFSDSAPSGGNLKAALDYLLPYTCEPDKWPHPQETKWQNDFMHSVLSVASGIYQEQRYAEALDCLDTGDTLYPYLLVPASE